MEATTGGNYYAAKFVQVLAYCAVDIYGLISGYVGYNEESKTFRTYKLLNLWTQVFCYSFGIALCTFIVKRSLSITDLLHYAFPISTKQYWYFSAYVALLILIPWINEFLHTIGLIKHRNLTILLISLFSIFIMFTSRSEDGGDPFALNYGYSLFWLIILYIIGAYLKRSGMIQRVSKKMASFAIVLCVIVVWLVTSFCQHEFCNLRVLEYTSPFILTISISYLTIFSRFQFRNFSKRLIVFFAPASFGVYLIHTQKIIWNSLMNKTFVWIAGTNICLLPAVVFACAAGILIICLLIEKMRIWVFRLLKIDYCIRLIGDRIDSIIRRLQNS